MGEDSLLERVTAAAEERQLWHNSLLTTVLPLMNLSGNVQIADL
jgi:hypothetical protein